MAITIDQMQVEVQLNTEPVQVPAASEAPKRPSNPRKDLLSLIERDLRLKAD